MKSKRKDKRGHWPKGKRRNEDRGDWSRLRLRLASLINNYHLRGSVSIRVCADAIGVSDRTVRKYLDGTLRPTLDTQDAIETWIAEMRKRLRSPPPQRQ